VSMANIWFDRAWKRWRARKLTLDNIDNHHTLSIIRAAMSVPEVLDASFHVVDSFVYVIHIKVRRGWAELMNVIDRVELELEEFVPAGFDYDVSGEYE